MSIVPQIFMAVQQVEAALPQFKGPDKKAAATLVVKAVLSASEGIAGKDLVNDADVMLAVGGLMDAIVGIQNLVVAKTNEAKAAQAPKP